MQGAAGLSWHENEAWWGKSAMRGYQKQRSYEPFVNGYVEGRGPGVDVYGRTNSFNGDAIASRGAYATGYCAFPEPEIDWKAEGFLLSNVSCQHAVV